MRTRREESANYSSVFINGKTLRMPIDKNKTITELRFPEFYDVAINNRCYGNCVKYCYTSAMSTGKNFDNIIGKIRSFFGRKNKNEICYQVALGGAGESTIHPEFIDVLKTFKELDIVPNYTTNGMHLSDKVIEATKKYCGGVALTLHRHLEFHWRKGITTLINNNIKTNVHIIISDQESIDFLNKIYQDYHGKIDYFVLLPYKNTGFAANNPKDIDYDYFKIWMDKYHKNSDLALGANFYSWILKYKEHYDFSIYPPEIFSKYIIMDDDMKVYNNSFDLIERKYNNVEGIEILDNA
jgi:hypothetical protein